VCVCVCVVCMCVCVCVVNGLPCLCIHLTSTRRSLQEGTLNPSWTEQYVLDVDADNAYLRIDVWYG